MFCDQLRRDLLGCYGGTLVRTPNLDALAADGCVFDQAYTPVGICSPARASLMTGVYPHVHHMFNNSSPGYSYCQHLRPGITMMDRWLAENTECQTGYFGKWHIGPAEDLYAADFDITHKDYGVGEPLLSSSHWHPSTALGPAKQRVAERAAGEVAGMLDIQMEEFPDVIAARFTQRFLRERDSSRPSLGICAFPGPHMPWLVPDEFGIRYSADDIPLWPNHADTLEGKPINQRKLRRLQARPNGLLHVLEDDDTLRQSLACCFSYVELIDTMVGEIVATLRELGVYDETTVVFTTDHGDMAGSHGFGGKGAIMYEELYHIPLIVRPAGGTQTQRSDAPVNLMDVTSTCLHALTGTEQSGMDGQELQGHSLLPLTEGRTDWPREFSYSQYHGDWYGHYSSRMITDGEWKLVWNLTDLCELYDLRNDPHELENRFYDPACAATRDYYLEALQSEAARLGDGHVRYYIPDVEIDLV
jgi:arylsulfatase A-like enzyme